jgi:hypothetical protein
LFTLVTFVSGNRRRQRHATVTLGNVTVLALATLGSVTRNRKNPICVASPKVAKASE